MNDLKPTDAPARLALSWRLLVGAWLLLLIVLRLWDVTPPRVVGAQAAPEQFSAERARTDLQALTRAPRPSGTPAHRAAREYLLRRLAELGLKGEVQSTSVVGAWWGLPYDAAHVDNVMARLPGTDSTGAVLLMAHYDSVPHSPGAGDDAAGVAVLLETLRAMKATGALRNDLLFLFTDAEEAGALGAQAFRAQHPWARDVGVVINFDSRGTSGATVLYETSQGNARLIQAIAESVPRPVVSSLFPEVARRLGHSTDLRVFREAGVPAMNFGFSDSSSHYHTALDRLDHLDLRSVQHMGMYALALGRTFGDRDLRQLPSEDAVFFDVFLGWMVRYPRFLVLPFAALILLAQVAVMLRARSSGAASFRGIALGALGFLASIVLTMAATGAVLFVLRRTDPSLALMREPYEATWYRLGLTGMGAGVTAALYRLLRRWRTPEEVALGALLPWSVGLAVSSVLAPGASYFFAWPLAGALAGFAALSWARRTGRTSLSLAVLLLTAVPVIAVAAPGPFLLFVALQVQRGFVAVAVVALLMGALLPQVELLGAGRSFRPAALLAIVGVVLLGVALGRSGFSVEKPRPTGLTYAVDQASGQAWWLTTDDEPPPAQARLFPSQTARPGPGVISPYDLAYVTRAGSAPVESLPAPTVELLADEPAGPGRRLRLKVRSARQAPELTVIVSSETTVVRARIDGRDVVESPPHLSNEQRPWGFRYLGVPSEGFELVLELAEARPVELRVIDRTYSLPGSHEAPDLMSVPFYLAGSTFDSQRFRF
ncbi:M20/M25/M40 family metallo-hydrolase [Corallococcus sp. CA053C]|uniref:M20/M25/M40 family metallo-hydrolase n=1 Tax=Corallococcus sp. CA053C TaxID=2316732 RepID=UPI000EA2BA0B|nr:M20/M25/M40 family metallo-hydrolase [Corallococcus sp. CA053C]RKH06844.1 M20/M25/M40 family metallo-hydrolase [Corallococcus sp. CA053C]